MIRRLPNRSSKLVALIALALWLLQLASSSIHAQVAPTAPEISVEDCYNADKLITSTVVPTAEVTVAITDSPSTHHEPASHRIGGLVWKDENGDGIWQLSDPFIPNATVALYGNVNGQARADRETAPLLTATTTITGWYEFTGLAAGEYYVRFTTPGRMLPTLSNQGTDETLDSDSIRMSTSLVSQSEPVVFDGNGATAQIDAGFLLPATLTIYVYNDTNKDNQRQMGEGVVANTLMILYDLQGMEIARSSVLNNGSFRFEDLIPGQYLVEIQPPPAFTSSLSGLNQTAFLAPGSTLRYEAPVVPYTPNAVALASFAATRTDDVIQVQWYTTAEQDTLGYRILMFRDEVGRSKMSLTSNLIFSQGNGGGQYTLQIPYDSLYDGSLDALQFWLAEYEVNGAEKRYGPYYAIDANGPRLFLPIVRR